MDNVFSAGDVSLWCKPSGRLSDSDIVAFQSWQLRSKLNLPSFSVGDEFDLKSWVARTPGLIAWRDKAWSDDLWAVRRSDDEVAISRVGDDFEVVGPF